MVKQDPRALLREIISAPLAPPLLVLISPDQVRRKRVIETIKAKFFCNLGAESISAIDLSDGNNFSIAKLKDEMRSLSLFSPQRVFIFENAESLNAEKSKLFLSLIETSYKDTYLIISAKKLLATSPIRKLKNAAQIELEELKGYELLRWMEKEARQIGMGVVEEKALEALAKIGENDPDRLVTLIEQLAVFCGKDPLTLSALKILFAVPSEAEEFALVDSIAKSEKRRSLIMLEDLFKAGSNPFMLLGLLARSYCNLWLVREGGSSVEKMPPWRVAKHRSQGAKYKDDAIFTGFQALLATDARLKNKSLGPEILFHNLIEKLSP